MKHPYCCPTCGEVPHRIMRDSDFFCRACFTAFVIVDGVRAHVMGVNDNFPRAIAIEDCLPPGRTPELSYGVSA